MPRPNRKRRKSTAVISAVIFGLTCIAGYVGYVVYSLKKPHQVPGVAKTVSLESWLAGAQYAEFQPLRNDMPPGTVFQLRGAETNVAIQSSELCQSLSPTSSVSPDVVLSQTVSLTGDLAGEVVPGVTNSDVSGNQGTKILITLSGLHIDSYPLDTLEAAVKRDPELHSALKADNKSLYVITEAVKADKIECQFVDKNGASLSEGVKTAALQATLGSGFDLETDGSIKSNEPIYLGYKAAKIVDVAKTLGSGPTSLQLKPLTPEIIKKIQLETFNRASRRPRVQLFALVVGQGNYDSGQGRAKGQLPGAVSSAQLVSQDVSSLLGPNESSNLVELTSNELGAGLFDQKQISKNQFQQTLVQFVTMCKQKRDRSRPCVVLFYYFGHGLADGLSKSVFLVPEDFRDKSGKTVIDMSGNLIDLKDVSDSLTQISKNAIILVDACRSHSEDDKELLHLWSKPMEQSSQSTSSLQGILGVLQFDTGIYGPVPIIFGSEDATNTDPVVCPYLPDAPAVGPVALRFDNMVTTAISSGETVTLPEAVDTLVSPAPIGTGKTTIRGYTAMRTDFRNQLISVDIIERNRSDVNY